jgi:peptidoglycan/LPS O-acetylase OafA/YrhL
MQSSPQDRRSRAPFNLPNGTARMQARNEPLDWLRGLLAVSIMVYHLTAWEIAQPDASSVLGRLGAYGVSMFFILSGLSIALVYHRFIVGKTSALRFFVRRVFRIWPLLWIAVFAVWTMRAAGGEYLDWKLVHANLTTLFGFVRPSAYINSGAWSIGNEMVYYALTPAILAVYNRSRLAGNLLALATVVIGLLFSHVWLSPQAPLADQWTVYINPFNNLFLYCAGIAMYYNADHLKPTNAVCLALLAAGAAVLALHPVDGNQIHIVTGWTRIVFCLASIAIVFAFYKTTIRAIPFVSAPLTQLGLATYGVYLLHPVLWQALSMLFRHVDHRPPPAAMFTLTVLTTVVVASCLYRYFEAPFIAWGKKLTSGQSSAMFARKNAGPGGRIVDVTSHKDQEQ